MGARRDFLPAAGRDWLLPLYDPFVWLVGGEKARKALLDQAAVEPTHHVLDIGCGTGTLAVLIKRLHPEVEVVGLDPDPKALARAARKAENAAAAVRFDQGYADELPYAVASFDRVFSSFMLHHLSADVKEGTLREVHRVLAPGGSLHLVDFAASAARLHRLFARVFHSNTHPHEDEDRLLALLRDAGFADPKVVERRSMLLVPLTYYQATR